MNGRDDRGRFTPGNPHASLGGKARAETLTPERRSEIARQGWAALVELYFDGDRAKAADWLGKLGAWAIENTAYAGTPLYNGAWEHPGPVTAQAGGAS